jgi:hypothetical protein
VALAVVMKVAHHKAAFGNDVISKETVEASSNKVHRHRATRRRGRHWPRSPAPFPATNHHLPFPSRGRRRLLLGLATPRLWLCRSVSSICHEPSHKRILRRRRMTRGGTEVLCWGFALAATRGGRRTLKRGLALALHHICEGGHRGGVGAAVRPALRSGRAEKQPFSELFFGSLRERQ